MTALIKIVARTFTAAGIASLGAATLIVTHGSLAMAFHAFVVTPVAILAYAAAGYWLDAKIAAATLPRRKQPRREVCTRLAAQPV